MPVIHCPRWEPPETFEDGVGMVKAKMVRSDNGKFIDLAYLNRANHRITDLEYELRELKKEHQVLKDIIETRDLLEVALAKQMTQFVEESFREAQQQLKSISKKRR